MKRLLPILLLLASSATPADSGSYQVEVIVFRNLMVQTQTPVKVRSGEATSRSGSWQGPPGNLQETRRGREPELRSFSQFPALDEPGQTEDSSAGTGDGLSSNLPDELHVMTQKSPRMADIWRSLSSSGDYQPLVYAGWQQNRVDYYPPIRIHDQQIIDTQLHQPANITVLDYTVEDPLGVFRKIFYRLDGSVQLRRTRFLHLFLDLEYREQDYATADTAGFLGRDNTHSENQAGFWAGDDSQSGLEMKTGRGSGFSIFALKQNRQIRTGQTQYFDTPYWGVLAYVTAIPGDMKQTQP